MCGPSAQEQQLANQEGSLSQSLMNAYNERFSTQTDILGQVQKSLGQLQSGNYPPGYSPSVMAALRTSVLNNVAGATTAARQAAANAGAGQGGGASSPLESGIQQQIAGAIATGMAGKQSDLLNQLTLQNYDVGRQNLLQSISGLQTLAGAENPESFASGASSATSQAFGEAKTINQQKNQWQADLAGLVTGGVSALAGGVGKGLFSKIGGGRSVPSGIGSFADSGVFSSTTPTDLASSESGFGTDWLTNPTAAAGLNTLAGNE